MGKNIQSQLRRYQSDLTAVDLELSQTSKMEFFAKTADSFK